MNNNETDETDYRSGVVVRFDIICGSSKESDRFVARIVMAQVPSPGECVVVEGWPYVVHSRDWAINKENGGRTHAFLRVTRLRAGCDYPIGKYLAEEKKS